MKLTKLKVLTSGLTGTMLTIALTSVVVYAAFVFTFNINGNSVSAASADLTVTTGGKPLTGVDFIPGQTTADGTIDITNNGTKGNLTLIVQNKSGTLCPDLTLLVKRGATELYNGTVTAATTIAVDATFNHNENGVLTQNAKLSETSVLSGQTCTWDEVVKLEN